MYTYLHMNGKSALNTFAFNHFIVQLSPHKLEVFAGAAALIDPCLCWSVVLLNKRCGTLWVGPLCASDNANNEQSAEIWQSAVTKYTNFGAVDNFNNNNNSKNLMPLLFMRAVGIVCHIRRLELICINRLLTPKLLSLCAADGKIKACFLAVSSCLWFVVVCMWVPDGDTFLQTNCTRSAFHTLEYRYISIYVYAKICVMCSYFFLYKLRVFNMRVSSYFYTNFSNRIIACHH